MAELSVERSMYRPLNAAGRATKAREQADWAFGRKDGMGRVVHVVDKPADNYRHRHNGGSVLAPPAGSAGQRWRSSVVRKAFVLRK